MFDKMDEPRSEVEILKGPRFGIRHVQILLLFLNITCIYFSRLNVSVAVVAMTNAETTNPDFPEFDWSEKEKNYIISSFYWGYVFTQVPGGYLNRSFGAKTVLLACTFSSSILTLFTPYLVTIGGWQTYCVVGAIQGLLQGAVFPSINDHIAKWAPNEERYVLGALAFSGTNCGDVVSMLLSGLIAASPIGWPGISYISGGLGITWCALWFVFGARNALSSRNISKEECHYIESSLNRGKDFHKKKMPIPWLAMFTSGPFLALIVAECCETWSSTTLQNQIPSYMNGILNMNIKSNAVFSALPYITRWIMTYVYTFVGMKVVNKGWLNITNMRKTSNTLASWIPAVLLIAIGFLDAEQTALAISILVVSVGIEAGSSTGCLLCTVDLAVNHAGIVMGITNSISSIIPFLTPLFVGAIVSDAHDRSEWQIVFAVAACIGFIGNLVFIIFGSAEPAPWDAPDFMLKDNIEEPVKEPDHKSTFQDIFGSENVKQESIKNVKENDMIKNGLA